MTILQPSIEAFQNELNDRSIRELEAKIASVLTSSEFFSFQSRFNCLITFIPNMVVPIVDN